MWVYLGGFDIVFNFVLFMFLILSVNMMIFVFLVIFVLLIVFWKEFDDLFVMIRVILVVFFCELFLKIDFFVSFIFLLVVVFFVLKLMKFMVFFKDVWFWCFLNLNFNFVVLLKDMMVIWEFLGFMFNLWVIFFMKLSMLIKLKYLIFFEVFIMKVRFIW